MRVVYMFKDGSKAIVTDKDDNTGLYLINTSDMKNESAGGGST